jgi:hypothetical protein
MLVSKNAAEGIFPRVLSLITLHHCGETYFADDAHVGRQIKCVICGDVLIVARPQPAPVTRAEKVGEHEVKYASQTPRRRQRGSFFPDTKSWKLVGLVAVVTLIALIEVARIVDRWVPASSLPAHTSSLPKPTSSFLDSAATSQPAETSQFLVPGRLPVSLATGTGMRRSRGPRGHGVVTIVNGTDLDAIVKLVLVDSPAIVCQAIYIRAGGQSALSHVGPGTYKLRFSLGRDWDSSRKRFLASASYSEFENSLLFEERREGEKTSYQEFEMTLNAVPFGNARTHGIDESVFSEGNSEE